MYLRITPVLDSCDDHNTTTTEQYDWCGRNASTSKKLEEYLMRFLINSTIADVNKYKPYIGNYFKARKNSGIGEGLNNKIKVLKRRCYGLFNIESLFQRLFLDLQAGQIYA